MFIASGRSSLAALIQDARFAKTIADAVAGLGRPGMNALVAICAAILISKDFSIALPKGIPVDLVIE
jgi:hypothetical protein